MSEFLEGLSVNPLDAIVVMVLIVFGIASYMRGFTASALTIAAWGGSFMITSYYAPSTIPYISDVVKPEMIAFIITYAVMFIFSLFLLKMIAGIIGKIIKDSNIGSLDSAMGLLFGLFSGMFVVSAVYMLTTPFISENNQPDWFRQAKSRPLIQYGASMISAVNPYFDELDLQEKRKDLEALERLKKMMPSYPAKNKKPEKYDKKTQQEMNKLFEKLSSEE